jgi:PhnB protein
MRAIPMVSYQDVGAAVPWLERVFGFRERGERFVDEDGRVTHAELERDGATVMLGWPGPAYRGPRSHAGTCEQARAWLANPYVIDGVFVSVEDVDLHCERARAAGAEIIREPEETPAGRLYGAADLEGPRWMFMSPRTTG